MRDVLLLTTLLICLYTDLKKRKIYNAVLLPSLILGVVLNVVSDGYQGLLNSEQGFLLGLGLLLIPFIFGGIGAGDVKLLAVIGGIKGPEFVFLTFLGMGIVGGIIALGILIFQGRLGKTGRSLGRGLVILLISRFRVTAFGGDKEKNLYPYGIAISAGVMAAYAVGVM
ncbi:MAG: A24 family peptidase [Bacillota bacterium]|jgi:prepilin peptidase CpaA